MAQPVFDYSAGMPWVTTERLEAFVRDAAADWPLTAAERLREETVRELRTNPAYRDQLREAYDAAGVNLSSVTMFGRDPTQTYMGPEQVQRAITRWTARFDLVDWLHKVTSPEQARCVAERDEVGIVMNVQDLGAAVGGDVDGVDRLYNQGVRIMQLTYNRQNTLGTGCTDRSDGGLSYRGLEVVDRMNELGSVVDLSHCGRETTLDAIAHSDAPPSFTHTFCTEVAEHDRGKSDEELKALADADGYVGILGLRFFIGAGMDDPSFDVFFDHLEHAVDVVGVDRVGIGSDFSENHDVDYPGEIHADDPQDGAGWRDEHGVSEPGHFDRFQRFGDWSVIRDGLTERYTDREVEKILGENFLNYWERVA